MVIENRYLIWSAIGPRERHSILLINPNAILPGAIALEFLESIGRRASEVVELFSLI
jgi:hypothetical protein